ncbi:Sodium- and chloride-dependent glycine transporter 2 [Frankliniella fusca]|uniref:Transporter n=1 Tax=Frankliniella fusca TaxID=407009 RepID=A0AAE1LNH7_9NEOP|nr:Sodium- and chloride-dependent glycine transporter 2 [Frankliniella fusca]
MADAVAPVEHHRGSWASPLEFIMSCLNYAIGLGNVWRFPYLAYRNGGGAFLGPYIIMLCLIGLPIFFLELAIGQYAGLGPIEAFQRISPFFHGLGYCTLVVITLITVYYQVIVAWAMFYIFNSFSYELGWGSCKHDFNSARCFSESANSDCLANSSSQQPQDLLTYYNRTCQRIEDLCRGYGMHALNATHCGLNGTTEASLKSLLNRVLASEEYYNDYVLGRKGATWEDWGDFHWLMCLYLFLSWIVLYACLARGVQSSGKAAYFTTIFPIVLLTILLCRGATLPGAYEGVAYYITPRWETLLNAAVWGDAASQVFYSFGIGCGSLITLSSYSKFTNNCHTDALIVSVTNLGTAVFAGFAVFTVMGFLANQQGVAVTDVVDSGPGLAFIVYPEAILRMPAPQVWAVLFFFMLFILGLGSQFAGVQAITTAVIDKWPQLSSKQWLVTLCACLGCFLMEIPMCYSGGVYLFTLLDWNTASWAILLIGFAEIIVVSWVYGCERFLENLSQMGIKFYAPIRAYWRFVWVFASPIISLAVFVFVMSQYVPAAYGNYSFPFWADIIGWLVSISTLLPFPIFAVYRIIYGKEVGKDLFNASPMWCPREDGCKVIDEERSSSDFTEGVKLDCLNGNGHIISHFVYDNVAFARDNART